MIERRQSLICAAKRKAREAKFTDFYLVALVVLAAPTSSLAQDSVVSTVHNLSVTGPGEIRSLTETEVCKFCHIPHNAIEPEPLWGHGLSEVQQYEVPAVRAEVTGQSLAPQPDGSSRLCLSCHDGTVALGEVAGERMPIPVVGEQRLRPGRRGYIGTDLTGSHPISFVVSDGLQEAMGSERDMRLKPVAVIGSDRDVKLDKNNKMQCTTCHDPHSDQFYQEGRVPRFWVKPSVEGVCLTCHELR
jgi:hypothetical protein